MPLELNNVDFKILQCLHQDARISLKVLAAKINKSPSATSARIKKLEAFGYIKKYVTVIDLNAATTSFKSIISIQLKEHSKENLKLFERMITDVPEIIKCYQVNGQFDFVLHIVVNDMKHYQDCITNKILKTRNIGNISTHIVFNELRNKNLLRY